MDVASHPDGGRLARAGVAPPALGNSWNRAVVDEKGGHRYQICLSARNHRNCGAVLGSSVDGGRRVRGRQFREPEEEEPAALQLRRDPHQVLPQVCRVGLVGRLRPFRLGRFSLAVPEVVLVGFVFPRLSRIGIRIEFDLSREVELL